MSRDWPNLNEVISGVTGAEGSSEEQVEAVGPLLGLQQLVVLLGVQGNTALAVAPGVLPSKNIRTRTHARRHAHTHKKCGQPDSAAPRCSKVQQLHLAFKDDINRPSIKAIRGFP